MKANLYIYRCAAGLVFLILYSICASYRLIVSSNTAREKVALRHATTWTTSTFIPLAAEKVKEITESDIHFVRGNEITKSNWPSWGNGTIQIQPMLDFISRLLVDPMNTYAETRKISVYQRGMFIETPYIVSRSGVYCSRTLKRRNTRFQQRHRLLPVEGVMNEALQLLLSSREEERKTKWARLDTLLIQKDQSFPFLIYAGDYKSCDFNNYRDEHNVTHSLPLFSFGVKANALGCWNGFPIASYKMTRDSKLTSQDWDSEFEDRDRRFPWREKVPKAVWRGSLSDVRFAGVISPRMKLVARANHEFSNTSLFDVGFSSVSADHFEAFENFTLMYPMKTSIRPFLELQNYVAVIDIDGNAWSSRFPTQLCLNSVTMKVEPRYSDYFMGSQVQPGVHYIPIKADSSDLLEKTLWVMLHPNETQQIIANARQWCREHMVWKSLAHDLLDSWEKYITWMSEGDPQWYDVWEKQWKEWGRKESMLAFFRPFRKSFRPFKVTPKLSRYTLRGRFPSS